MVSSDFLLEDNTMRKLKSILSVLVAVAMLFSIVPFAFAEETTDTVTAVETAIASPITLSDIDVNTTEGAAVETLVELGVIQGYPDGTFKSANTITRAEFTAVITRFLNLTASVSEDIAVVTAYADLNADPTLSWATGYVKLATDLKIIEGFEDGTFRGNDPVTYEQAVKMIVAALGYTVVADQEYAKLENPASWSSGFIAVATQKNILKNIVATNGISAPASRGLVSMLIYNALDVDKLVENNDGTYSIEKGSSASDSLRGDTKITGIVTGTFITGLNTSNPGLAKDEIEIDGRTYKTNGTYDYEAYLGRKVTVYLDADKSDEIRQIKIANSNDSVKVEKYQLASTTNSTITYYSNRDKEKTIKANIPDVKVIYNGKYMPGYNLADLKDNLECGYVELVCNDGDGTYEIAFVNSYQTYVVSKVDNTNKIIYLLYKYKDGAGADLEALYDIPEEATSQIRLSMTCEGKDITLSSLKKWDVVNIRDSHYNATGAKADANRKPTGASGKRVLDIIVTRDTAKGTVSEIIGTDGRKIAGTDYYYSDTYKALSDEYRPAMGINDNAEAYLDCMGEIAAAVYDASTSNFQYGYLIDARQNSDASDSNNDLELYILTSNGSKTVFGTSKNVKIDGVSEKATSSDIMNKLKAGHNVNKRYDTDNASSITNVVSEDGNTYTQLIRYSLNSSNLVNEIDTLSPSSVGDDLTCDFLYEGAKQYSSSRTFSFYGTNGGNAGTCTVTSSTKIFFIPDDRTDTDSFYTISYGDAFTSGGNYHVEVFNCSKTNAKNADVVLLYKSNMSMEFTSNSPMMLVSAKSEKADGTTIKGYLRFAPNETSITIEDGDCDVTSADGTVKSLDDISVGDVIMYRTVAGKVEEIKLWYDAENPSMQEQDCSTIEDIVDNRIYAMSNSTKYDSNNKVYPGYDAAGFRLQYGSVISIDTEEDETVTISSTITSDSIGVQNSGNNIPTNVGCKKDYVVHTFKLNSTVKDRIYKYNSSDGSLTKGNEYEALNAYDEFAENPSRVIVFSQSGTLYGICIVE